MPNWVATEHGVVANTTSANPQQVALNTAALNLSDAGGGNLIILTGQRIVTTGAYVGADNVTLVIEHGGALAKESTSSSNLIFFDGCRNTHVTGGGTLDAGPAAGNTERSNRIRIRNSQNVSVTGMTIINGARSVQIQSGSAVDTSPRGISSDITISHNHFAGSHRNVAIEVARNDSTSEGSDLGSENVSCDGNTFDEIERYSADTPPWTAIYYSGVTGGTVRDNVVLQSDDTAVMIAGGCVGVVVSGTRATTNQVCIYLGASRSCSVIDNPRLQSLNDIGIAVHARPDAVASGGYTVGNHIVSGNHIVGTDRNGISVEGVSDVLVIGNKIRNPAGGIVRTTVVGTTATFVYSGSVPYTFVNLGPGSIRVGDASITPTSGGTEVEKDEPYTYHPQTGTGTTSDPYVPGTPAYAVSTSGQPATVRRTLPDVYRAAILVQPNTVGAATIRPDNVSLIGNLVTLGASDGGSSGVIGIKTSGALKNFTCVGNNIDSAITNQYSFSTAFGQGADVQVAGRTDGKLYVASGGTNGFFPVLLGAAATPS
ncbi:right-handed parallel beta-helix repeat-containing protein [Herbiconiux sp.]|uniref:right-handed parallel beta-helix repeat-containing protein n=1 Tax=Herbiconiux sp. TaxID=1871186 RepID=UPI0025BAA455|nr:right-handed parallel beta-helix repeat-containing protein [Herbiconiux sp.]